MHDLVIRHGRIAQGRGDEATITSGVVVRQDDEPTGERPGGLIRGRGGASSPSAPATTPTRPAEPAGMA